MFELKFVFLIISVYRFVSGNSDLRNSFSLTLLEFFFFYGVWVLKLSIVGENRILCRVKGGLVLCLFFIVRSF